MIDVETDVFSRIATALREEFPGIFVIGEYVKSPPKFPCVSLMEVDNVTYKRTQTGDETENHAEILIEVNIYSNKTSAKKTECRSIAAFVDSGMAALGFTRTMLQPIPNMDDATIYRMTGRYVAVVAKDKTIFRR